MPEGPSEPPHTHTQLTHLQGHWTGKEGNKGILPKGIPLCFCEGVWMCAERNHKYAEPHKMCDFASFGTFCARKFMCVRVCGYVSVSVEANSCLKCVHTCSQMNEAEGSELSCDSGSCQHCGVCDVWAHPSLPAPLVRRGRNGNPTSFPIFPSVKSHPELYLSFVFSCSVHFLLFFFVYMFAQMTKTG